MSNVSHVCTWAGKCLCQDRPADATHSHTRWIVVTSTSGDSEPPSPRTQLQFRSLCWRGAQGTSRNAGGHASTSSTLKPTVRSVAAVQDSLSVWWASLLSTTAHVKMFEEAAQDGWKGRLNEKNMAYVAAAEQLETSSGLTNAGNVLRGCK